MATVPRTYRVSDDVDAELRRLGEIHGGVNRALRRVLFVTAADTVVAHVVNVAPRKQSKKERAIAELAASDLTAQAIGGRPDVEYGSSETVPRGQHVGAIAAKIQSDVEIFQKDLNRPPHIPVADWRAGRKPLLKPKERR